jgi:predicted HD superfamily hydrolase involved in NAD metabolism
MADLPKWHKAKELVEKVHFISVERPGVNVNFEELQNFFGEEGMQHIHQIKSPALEISSTDLRDRVKKGRSIKYFVPEVVEEYIYKEQLYFMSADSMRHELQKRLKKERFAHSVGVANTALKLAKKFGVDERKAYVAGLLHDCAREFENDQLKDEATKRGIEIGEVESSMPLLLHSYIGAKMISEIYDVHDEEIAQAIYRHTVGARDMTPLDKIIYFADMIEPNRNYPGVEKLRELAEKSNNLDEIILTALNESIIFVTQKNSLVHPDTIAARNFLLLQKEKLK